MKIRKTKKENLKEILALQYLAYQSEAKLLNNYNIQPLTQKLEEIEFEFESGTILEAANEDGIIVGSVRAYVKDDTLYVGKLIVHPDWQGQGVGTALLAAIEKACPQNRSELFTSSKSAGNIKLYERVGYRVFSRKTISDDLEFVYMEKQQ